MHGVLYHQGNGRGEAKVPDCDLIGFWMGFGIHNICSRGDRLKKWGQVKPGKGGLLVLWGR